MHVHVEGYIGLSLHSTVTLAYDWPLHSCHIARIIITAPEIHIRFACVKRSACLPATAR